MRTRHLGSSGLVVSLVGLGCNNFGGRLDAAGTRAVVDAALDAGITLFDTADIYGGAGGSETLLGELLAGRREQVVLATKFGMDMGGAYGDDFGARGSRRYIRRAIEGSLRRLRTDHVDLYQMHAPDPSTPLAETVDALLELVAEGKVRYLGHSQFSAAQITEAHYLTRGGPRPGTGFISAQNHYSLLERDVEADVIGACVQFGLGMLPFYPLARGLLTGKVSRKHGAPPGSRLHGEDDYLTADKFDRIEALTGWGSQHGRTLLELAIGGLAAQPAVASVIAGASTPEQVRANVAAGDWQPGPDELAAIDAICPPRRPAAADPPTRPGG